MKKYETPFVKFEDIESSDIILSSGGGTIIPGTGEMPPMPLDGGTIGGTTGGKITIGGTTTGGVSAGDLFGNR